MQSIPAPRFDIPARELKIIRKAIEFAVAEVPTKPNDPYIPDERYCEVQCYTVILRNAEHYLGAFSFQPPRKSYWFRRD